jgi:multimeric flavodoxin WrbA
VNILGICSSAHLNGNTSYALQHCMDVIKSSGFDTKTIYLAQKKFEPCSGCFHCSKGSCIHNDDMEEICQALCDCDGLILASPVYMGLVNGLMKNMMDRTVQLRSGGQFRLSGKIGGGIACGWFRNGGQELTLQCMHTYFLQQDMLAVADGPNFSHSGAAIVAEAKTDTVGLKTVEHLAARIIKAVNERNTK